MIKTRPYHSRAFCCRDPVGPQFRNFRRFGGMQSPNPLPLGGVIAVDLLLLSAQIWVHVTHMPHFSCGVVCVGVEQGMRSFWSGKKASAAPYSIGPFSFDAGANALHHVKIVPVFSMAALPVRPTFIVEAKPTPQYRDRFAFKCRQVSPHTFELEVRRSVTFMLPSSISQMTLLAPSRSPFLRSSPSSELVLRDERVR